MFVTFKRSDCVTLLWSYATDRTMGSNRFIIEKCEIHQNINIWTMIYVLRVTIIKMYLQLATNLPYTINLRQNTTSMASLVYRLYLQKRQNLTIGNLTDQ